MKFISTALLLLCACALAGKADLTESETRYIDSLQYIAFEAGKPSILPTQQTRLDSFAIILKKYPAITVELSIRPEKPIDLPANILLSQKRATYFCAYLEQKGISPTRFQHNLKSHKYLWQERPDVRLNQAMTLAIVLHW
ncbi:MAG: hypothetical protein EAZ95_15895 [Bacteroidetes bacterium]|nr:MAG: hypothetical protein EAZ95_15895 [Bacteroidota bacterium]